MCDACGVKLRLLGRKVCPLCQHYFCSNCIIPKTSKNIIVCKICSILELGVIERDHLKTLTIIDLKYYARRKDMVTPIDVTTIELIDAILGQQANDLSKKANKALSQVTGIALGATFEDIDPVTLEPRLATYPSVSQSEAVGGLSTSERTDGHGATPNVTKEYFSTPRKRPKEDVSMITSLEDMTDHEQIRDLSVKQLKLILQKNCINYKGCLEKQELLDKVVRLWQAREEEKIMQEIIAQRGDTDAESEYLCKICMDAPVDCVLLECGHMLTCVKCGRKLAECPVCRQYVSRVVHAFRV